MNFLSRTLTLCAAICSLAPAQKFPRTPAATPSNTSVYSSLDEKVCKTQKTSSEGGYSEQICPGYGGFRLKVVDADARMSVTVISVDGKQHDLNFFETVTPRFSSVGPRAEWRVRRANGRQTLVALTVRLNANEDDARPSAITSYLVVARVDGAQVCVVKVLKSSLTALDEARVVADHAGELPCVKP